MLRQGYKPHITYDFFVIADDLAQLLHCLMGVSREDSCVEGRVSRPIRCVYWG